MNGHGRQIMWKIFEEIIRGRSVNRILRMPGMPSGETFYSWVRGIAEVRAMYVAACALRRDILADEIIEIADQDRSPASAAVRIKARIYVAEMLEPKKYGR